MACLSFFHTKSRYLVCILHYGTPHFGLATLQMFSSHMWLVVTRWESAALDNMESKVFIELPGFCGRKASPPTSELWFFESGHNVY